MKHEAFTVASYFEQDHDRLDALLTTFHKLKRTDFARATERFREFKLGLQRHIVWEEALLFPLWEERSGITDGPTAVMRMEHRRIGAALEALHHKVKIGDPDCDAEERALLALLEAHNLKEERVLYPAIDQAIGDAERATLFQRMQDLPEERDHVCCGPPEG
ncbi:hemerythrin domain-containing protein [Nitrospira sp. Kam-Ns4a]